MADTFKIEIFSPEGKVHETEARSLVAPAALGYMGVLANHAPLLTTLAPGVITIRSANDSVSKFDSNGGGFMEVSKNRAVLLVDAVKPRI